MYTIGFIIIIIIIIIIQSSCIGMDCWHKLQLSQSLNDEPMINDSMIIYIQTKSPSDKLGLGLGI